MAGRSFARCIRRCLEESLLTTGQKKLVLDGLSARLSEFLQSPEYKATEKSCPQRCGAKLAVIVIEQGEKVCDVIGKIYRGSTIIPSIGGYQKTEKQVAIRVCSTKQMVELQKVVKSVDPASFTIILDSNEVHRTGFSTVQFGDLVP